MAYLPCKRSARDNSPTRVNFPPSCVTSNRANLSGIIQFHKHPKIKSYFLCTIIIARVSHRELSNLVPLQRMSGMTKHVSKAGKVDPGDRVTLPVKFSCKQELTLTRLLG